MADSGSLRVRRHRLHARGDHSLCKRCAARTAAVAVPAAAGAREGEFDAQASLRALAERLEAAHEANPGDAALARVLKETLLALPPADDAADPLDVLRDLAGRVS